MPQFELQNSDASVNGLAFDDLPEIVQGYIEALFFTETSPDTKAEWNEASTEEGSVPNDSGFSDLTEDALLDILKDVATFTESAAWLAFKASEHADQIADKQAGHDLWLTRNGHGAGFWDGDWPEPHGDALTEASKELGECWVTYGDDGAVHI